MKIRIENIGPVKIVDLDITKPLIIFTGLNGTGKTYVSYVLYAICRLFVFKKDILNWKELVNLRQTESNGVLDADYLYKILKNHLTVINKILNLVFGVKYDDDLVRDTKITLLTTKDEFRDSIKSEEFIINAYNTFDFI